MKDRQFASELIKLVKSDTWEALIELWEKQEENYISGALNGKPEYLGDIRGLRKARAVILDYIDEYYRKDDDEKDETEGGLEE